MQEAAVLKSAEADARAFEFVPGIFGFPHLKRFLVADLPGGGDIFKQMIAVEEPEVGFTLVQPLAFFPSYTPAIGPGELAELGAESPEQVILMVIANVPTQFKQATANLKAPLLFNPFTRKARQVILPDDRYKTRERLFQG